ncbi:hypothetical protein GA0070623_4955 [Micromonospora rifamycinica]|uniref:Uncharacterized protein n=1 Tax=Micromonospora rifamycinica TaxID=291594 RepID=A0A1C5KCD5_9ACTN|nr:hypothetical protein GA0070623_4955 [Micromonospora rifamycinica]
MCATHEDPLVAAALTLTLVRRHRPTRSPTRWRRVCRCGAELPYRAELPCRVGRRALPGRALLGRALPGGGDRPGVAS